MGVCTLQNFSFSGSAALADSLCPLFQFVSQGIELDIEKKAVSREKKRGSGKRPLSGRIDY